jgi:hypothetical protein
MATKVKRLTDELQAPTLPGKVDNNAVKTAAAGVQNARNAVTNMTYDNFKSGDLYKGLQRDYQQGGQMAMKDTLGQVAARTGGMASSYATSAANQSYNNYMQGLEDAARSLFNDEYSRAKDKYNTARDEYSTAYGEYRDAVGDDRYDKEWNYQVGRDTKADNEADTKAAQNEVMAILEAGGEPPVDLLIKAGWLEEINPANKSETPDYDLDKNGIPDGLSGLAATMWQNNIDAEGKTAAVNDIEARIANGDSLEDIAAAYGIGADDKTWESVTGMSKAEWTKKFNDNTTSSYTYQNTNAGRTEIVDTLVNNRDFKLSSKDQNNFNHLFGEGAYDAVQDFISGVAMINGANDQDKERAWDEYQSYETELSDFGFTIDQIESILEAINPDLYNAFFR